MRVHQNFMSETHAFNGDSPMYHPFGVGEAICYRLRIHMDMVCNTDVIVGVFRVRSIVRVAATATEQRAYSEMPEQDLASQGPVYV